MSRSTRLEWAESNRHLVSRASDGTSDFSECHRTAFYTQHLQVTARFTFILTHGLLLFISSIALGAGAKVSWWLLFSPVWLGNALSLLLLIGGWFASCPYIRECLQAHQARLGMRNPSIMTQLLPQIVMSIGGLAGLMLVVAGETMLCWDLDTRSWGEEPSFGRSCAIFAVLSLLVGCQGLCVRGAEALLVLGACLMATCGVAAWVPGGALGPSVWAVAVPSLAGSVGLQLLAIRGFGACRPILIREERLLRVAEQLAFIGITLSLGSMIYCLCEQGVGLGESLAPSICGAVAGVCICIIAALQVRMALLEHRSCGVSERLTLLTALEIAASHSRALSPQSSS